MCFVFEKLTCVFHHAFGEKNNFIYLLCAIFFLAEALDYNL